MICRAPSRPRTPGSCGFGLEPRPFLVKKPSMPCLPLCCAVWPSLGMVLLGSVNPDQLPVSSRTTCTPPATEVLRLLRLGLSFERMVGRLDSDFFAGAVALACAETSAAGSTSLCPNGGEPLLVVTRAGDVWLLVVAPVSSPLDLDLLEVMASVPNPVLDVVLTAAPTNLKERIRG